LLLFNTNVWCQVDLDGDGKPELLLAETQDDQQLNWRAVDFINSPKGYSTRELGLFGQAGWNPLLANWLKPDESTRTLVYRDTIGQINIQIDQIFPSLILGATTSKTTVIAGRDINSNGTADAVLIVERSDKLGWRFIFDPYTTEKNFRRIIFGKRGDTPFLFRERGKNDSLAVLNRNKILFRGMYSRIERTLRLARFFGGRRVVDTPPKTLRGSDGRDTLLFESSGGLVIGIKGRQGFQHTFKAEGSLLVGNFGLEEETFGSLNSATGELELVNGVLLEVFATGEPVGSQLISTYEATEASGTPIPIPTVGLGMTVEIATLTVTNTKTPIETARVTSTPTATDTATVPPTYTPYPTFTNTATFTATKYLGKSFPV
jgi:hypothetical protein